MTKSTTSGANGLLQQPLVVGLAAFVLGLLIGLPVLGWYVFPVEWTDSDLAHLRMDLKQEYVRLVAAAYAVDLDAQKAADRIAALGADGPTILSSMAASAGGPEQIRLQQLNQVVAATTPTTPTTPAGSTGGLLGGLWLPLVAGCLVVVVLLGGGAFLFMRMRGQGASAPARRPSTPQLSVEETPASPEVAAATGGTPSIARFMTTYTLGDDVYDDSFSVDGPDGNFLGECGMGISETIGVGDPKKVTAFEVWLFDKNDIRTVTKVLMSEHAFRDEALKSRLAAKGEPVQAMSGDTVSLETATLIVTARVVDMAYGGGALPPNSFFERMTIELQAYRKPGT
jgi:hypothetical protein